MICLEFLPLQPRSTSVRVLRATTECATIWSTSSTVLATEATTEPTATVRRQHMPNLDSVRAVFQVVFLPTVHPCAASITEELTHYFQLISTSARAPPVCTVTVWTRRTSSSVYASTSGAAQTAKVNSPKTHEFPITCAMYTDERTTPCNLCNFVSVNGTRTAASTECTIDPFDIVPFPDSSASSSFSALNVVLSVTSLLLICDARKQ